MVQLSVSNESYLVYEESLYKLNSRLMQVFIIKSKHRIRRSEIYIYFFELHFVTILILSCYILADNSS